MTSRSRRPDPVGDAQDDAEHDQRGADDPQVAEVPLDDVLEEHAEDHDRQGPHDDVPAHPRVDVAAQLGPDQGPRPHRADPPDVVPEEDEHRELGADLDDGRERGTGVAPPEELREDPEVGAARDRQELGQALEQTEEDGLEEVEHGANSSWKGCGRPRLSVVAQDRWVPGRPARTEDPSWLPDLAARSGCRAGCPARRRGRRGPASIVWAHATASPRPDRPQGLPPGSGHPHLGPRHRRARGPRPADRLHRGRRHAPRHGRRLRRRRVRGAHRVADRGRRGTRRPGHRHQGRASTGRAVDAPRTRPAAT